MTAAREAAGAALYVPGVDCPGSSLDGANRRMIAPAHGESSDTYVNGVTSLGALWNQQSRGPAPYRRARERGERTLLKPYSWP